MTAPHRGSAGVAALHPDPNDGAGDDSGTIQVCMTITRFSTRGAVNMRATSSRYAATLAEPRRGACI